MKKRNFIARDWLGEKKPMPYQSSGNETRILVSNELNLPSFSPRKITQNIDDLSFKPNQYLDLEWLSENLASKSCYVLNQTLGVLSKDVRTQIFSSRHFPAKIRNQFYEDFIAFAEVKSINTSLDTVDIFWNELRLESSQYFECLNEFLEELCHKISLIYLLKVRFFRVLSVYDKENFLPKELLSLHSLFLRYFKRNSSSEFDSSFLHSNHYSWYTPHLNCLEPIYDFFEACDELSYVDIVATFNNAVSGLSLKSHAISHKNTGLFINCLLLNFFQWLEKNKAKYDYCSVTEKKLNIVTCKLTGDYITDHSCGHWLAQHNNSYFKWNELICPEFESEDKYSRKFLNLINEIEYYTFLVKISSFYTESPIEFISYCSKEFNSNKQENYELQKNFLLDGVPQGKLSYDRLVISQLNSPKKNAHHSLLIKIQDILPQLKEDGYLVVLSSTNLFIHSQKSRVQSLLKKVTLESIIQLQDVDSKGELPPYIFLFSKKSKVELSDQEKALSKKETCYNFRLTGSLACYKDFSTITNELNLFFEKHLHDTPPFFRKDFGKGYQLEFFQDAIVDGKLIHSASEETGQITHPTFFKSMLQNCMPLNYFYELHTIDVEKLIKGGEGPDSQLDFDRDLLEFNHYGNDQFILIVNFNDVKNAKIELCPFHLLSGKAFQYGLSSCYYYRVVPKTKFLNSNIFREYFNSQVGKQITQMSVSGSYHQVKSKISCLLVPKLFDKHIELPIHLKECFKFLLCDEISIKEQDLFQLLNKLVDSKSTLNSLAQQYSYDVISYITNFKTVIGNYLYYSGSEISKTTAIDFNSQEVKTKLLNCDLVAFYPNNKDLFFEFHGEHRELPHALAKIVKREEVDGSILDFYSEEKLILSVYCSKLLGSFLDFLLKQMVGHPIIDILKNLKVPRDEMISQIITSYLDKSKVLNQLYEKSDQILNEIFRNSLVSKNS